MIVIVIAADQTVMFVPLAIHYGPAIVAIDVAIRVAIVSHDNRRFTNRGRDDNLRFHALSRRNHDRRWRSDHQPGRGRQREAKP